MPATATAERTPSPVPGARWLPWAVVLGLVLVGAAETIYLLRLPLVDLVRGIPDDSFFYLRVAQQFWVCGDFSFDGITQTYGFQPLWQLVVIGLQPLLPDAGQLLYGTLLLCVVLHVVTGGALFALCRALSGPAAGVGAAALWTLNPALMRWCWGLKENALYVLLLVLALHALLRLLRQPGTTRGVVLGLLLGLLVWNRVNAVLVAGVMLAAPLLALPVAGFRARLRDVFVAGLVMLAVAAPWYLFAWFHFGSALPTSGSWKLFIMKGHVEGNLKLPWLSLDHFAWALREWPVHLRRTVGNGLGWYEPLLLAMAALAVLGLPYAALRPARGGSHAWQILGWTLLAALAASYANVLFLERYLAYASWYAAPEYVALPLLFGLLTARAAPWLRRWPGRLVAAVVVAAAYVFWPAPPGLPLHRGTLTQLPRQTQLLEIGLWAARTVPDDARIGIWDPGIVSYFAQKTFVSMDPLMNSLPYQQGEIADPVGYVQRHGIAYMCGVGERRGGRWHYDQLPPGTYDIVWLPFPDLDLGWGEGKKHWMFVRPKVATAPAFLAPDNLPFGEWLPNDPERRRLLTGDRDRLLAGVELQADVVRLQLAEASASRGEVELRIDGAPIARLPAGAVGWQCFDLREHRGHRLQLAADPAAVRQAQLVDFTFPAR